MENSRGFVVVGALIGAGVIAACSSSTAPGPSSASLARIFDSAYVADSAAGNADLPRAITEDYLALMADEGLTPVAVQVTTDGGPLPMQMMAALSYDTTATGEPADSLALVVGWTADYSKYLLLVTEAVTANGPRVRRIPVTAARLSALVSMLRGNRRTTHAETAIAELTPIAFIVEGETDFDLADTTTGNITWSGGGNCSWQHVPISRYALDSTINCSHAAVGLDFAFHFPAEPGIDSTLSHMTMSSKLIPGVRLVGFNGF